MDGVGYDPGEASHAALLEIRRTLRRHPAVSAAVAEPPAQFLAVRAELDPRVLGRSSESGSLTVRWYAGTSPDASPEFVFHYSEPTGIDAGWHHEPNPHVDGWGHFQARAAPDEAYTYEPVTFEGEVPARVCWEVMDRLAAWLGEG